MARCEDLGPPYLEDAGVAVSVPALRASKDVESGLVAARGRVVGSGFHAWWVGTSDWRSSALWSQRVRIESSSMIRGFDKELVRSLFIGV